MNNYCTNCGNKLNKKDIKCDNCGTAVIDLSYLKRKKNKKNTKTIAIVFGIIVLVILFYFFVYPYLLMPLLKIQIKNKYDASNIKIDSHSSCYRCDGSCDGSCFSHKLILNCFEYDVSYEVNGVKKNSTFEIHNWKTDKLYDNSDYDDYDYLETDSENNYYDNNNDNYEDIDGQNYNSDEWSNYYIDEYGYSNYGG